MVKGNQSCLASVFSHTGKGDVVQDRIISDMMCSMELERPRVTLVLPEWDLGVVLEALSKPLYEPLQEASLKYLTYKTVLAMASAGRCSEVQAMVIDHSSSLRDLALLFILA